jgi:hypothetical protein
MTDWSPGVEGLLISLSFDRATALLPLMGQTFVPAHTVTVSDGSGATLSVDLLRVETLGVSCEELRLEVPSLGAATLDVPAVRPHRNRGRRQTVGDLLRRLKPFNEEKMNK